MLSGLDAPGHVLLPRRTLDVAFELVGAGDVAKGSHTVAATLEQTNHTVRAEARQDLTSSPRMALPLPKLDPGEYTLRLTIRDAKGNNCSELAQPVVATAGPLY